jgi:hypothetical protein
MSIEVVIGHVDPFDEGKVGDARKYVPSDIL